MSINVVSCLSFSLWHGKYSSIPFFKSKTTSPSRPLSKAGDSGGGDSDKACREGYTPKALRCIWIERDWSSFASPLPPTKRGEGKGGDALAPGLRYTAVPAVPTHTVPTFSTLPIDACSSKLSDHRRLVPTHCGSILGFWEHGRAMELFFLFRKVGWLSLGAGSLLDLQWTRGYDMVDAVAEVALLGLGWPFAFLDVMV